MIGHIESAKGIGPEFHRSFIFDVHRGKRGIFDRIVPKGLPGPPYEAHAGDQGERGSNDRSGKY